MFSHINSQILPSDYAQARFGLTRNSGSSPHRSALTWGSKPHKRLSAYTKPSKATNSGLHARQPALQAWRGTWDAKDRPSRFLFANGKRLRTGLEEGYIVLLGEWVPHGDDFPTSHVYSPTLFQRDRHPPFTSPVARAIFPENWFVRFSYGLTLREIRAHSCNVVLILTSSTFQHGFD